MQLECQQSLLDNYFLHVTLTSFCFLFFFLTTNSGAFSGKDWSKVDRSAAYTGRWIAKSIVAAGLARRALVQLSYAIGVAEPTSVFVDTYGTGTKSDAEILAIVKKNFDLRPGVIVKELDLFKPIYTKTACYGHFGRDEFTWYVLFLLARSFLRFTWLSEVSIANSIFLLYFRYQQGAAPRAQVLKSVTKEKKGV